MLIITRIFFNATSCCTGQGTDYSSTDGLGALPTAPGALSASHPSIALKMNAIHCVVVLHIGPARAIRNTLRHATLNEIDKTSFNFVDIHHIAHFAPLLHRANCIYFVDMAVWHPVLHAMAKWLVTLAKGSKWFVRIDMFALPLPSPWIHPGLSDDIKFLDWIPALSLHAKTAAYLGA